ncbi:MAG: hypothetical protein ACK4PR_08765, partial [Gammaproteobacteria bacterium]
IIMPIFVKNNDMYADHRISSLIQAKKVNLYIINCFKNNNFDFTKIDDKPYAAFMLNNTETPRQVITFSPYYLARWYKKLPDILKSSRYLPNVYKVYFEEQLFSMIKKRQFVPDTDFQQLTRIRNFAHKQNPSLRRIAQEKIPLPYTPKTFSEVDATNKYILSDILLKMIQQYSLQFAMIDNKRHIFLKPIKQNIPGYTFSHEELLNWYVKFLTEEQKASIPKGYQAYFDSRNSLQPNAEPTCCYLTDSNLEGLAKLNDLCLKHDGQPELEKRVSLANKTSPLRRQVNHTISPSSPLYKGSPLRQQVNHAISPSSPLYKAHTNRQSLPKKQVTDKKDTKTTFQGLDIPSVSSTPSFYNNATKPNNVAKSIDITKPDNIVNSNDTTNQNKNSAYQFCSFLSEKINDLALKNHWTISAPIQGRNNETYKLIKLKNEPTTQVYQYEKQVVISGAVTNANASIAVKIAATASDVITVHNDINDKASLAEAFKTILKEGKLPILRVSTDTTPTITQTEIFQYLDEKNPESPTPSEILQKNLTIVSGKAKEFYLNAYPAAPSPIHSKMGS